MLTRKIAYIDLTKGTVTKKDIPLEWRQKYLGARGINSYLLYSLIESPYDPLGPDNPLIFGAGLLTGLPGFGTGRLTVSALSPANGNLGDSNIGGNFGAELKYAGFDHLVIRGKSEVPVYIFIRNDDIEIRDARHLWGKDTWETQESIKAESRDDRVRTAAIGVAGENLVRMACIITGPKDAAGRYGMGAVMGSKKLKAITVRGTKDVTLAHPEELLTYAKEQNEIMMTRKFAKAMSRFGTPCLADALYERRLVRSRNDRVLAWDTMGEKGRALYAENWERYSLGKASCFGCWIHCKHRHLITEGPFAGTRGEGPEFGVIMNLGFDPEILDPEPVIYAGDMCNKLGLDVQDTGAMISFGIELYQNGIVSQDEVGRSLQWGDMDSVLSMIPDIANRKGFGDILADGTHALNRLPSEASQYLSRIRNTVFLSVGLPFIKSFALARVVATIGGHAHRNMPSIDVFGLPEEFLRNLYGGYVAPDPASYEGKALMVRWHEMLYAICDTLGCCRFQTVFESPNMPKFEEYSELVRLASDWDMPPEKLKEIAERIYTTERLSLGKLGVGSRKDDILPERWFTEPVQSGPKGEMEIIEREKFEELLDQYYELHGWDKNGVPTQQSIEKLGITKATI